MIWSSQEFGFCEPADDFSSGSSLMPQKKNPDAAELLRAKSPRVAGSLATLVGVLHALPLAYSKDLQEDKEALFDAVDTIELCLEAAERMLAGLRFDRERLGGGGGATRWSPRPTSPTCWCARGCRFARPTASSAGSSATALERGVALSELDREELAQHSELLDEEYYEVLARGAALESKVSRRRHRRRRRLREQLAAARGALDVAAGGHRGERASASSFFERSVHEVARELIGCELCFDGAGGVIVETESYERDDPACHAYVGLTPRTATLFGPPGRAYVYLSYGIHSLLNAVAEPEGSAAAVLIRALEPTHGIERDGRGAAAAAELRELCSGPGKLTEALGIGLELNGASLTEPPFELRARAARSGRRSRSRPARGSGSRRATELPVALLRRRQPVPLAAAARAAA